MNAVSFTPISVSPTEERTREGSVLWVLQNDVAVNISTWTTAVPAGFKFDFASVPRWLKRFLRDDLIYGIAALWHDWAYWKGIPKDMADAGFKTLLKQQHGPAWQIWLMVKAVEYFGHAAYRAHRRAGHPK